MIIMIYISKLDLAFLKRELYTQQVAELSLLQVRLLVADAVLFLIYLTKQPIKVPGRLDLQTYQPQRSHINNNHPEHPLFQPFSAQVGFHPPENLQYFQEIFFEKCMFLSGHKFSNVPSCQVYIGYCQVRRAPPFLIRYSLSIFTSEPENSRFQTWILFCCIIAYLYAIHYIHTYIYNTHIYTYTIAYTQRYVYLSFSLSPSPLLSSILFQKCPCKAINTSFTGFIVKFLITIFTDDVFVLCSSPWSPQYLSTS